MKLFASFIQQLRNKISLQWFLFGILSLLAFYKIFSFWFYHGWETSWLIGLTGGNFSFINLMKSHGLVSYMNYLLFGWRPFGWYATALVFHIITAMVVNLLVSRKTNKTTGLIAGLLFLITTAHHDVVTWGSFESLYAVQTTCFYLGLWCFDIYRKTKQIALYGVMVVCFILALFIRESGLLFLPLVFLFDLFLHEKIFAYKASSWLNHFLAVLRRHVVLWIIGVLYLFIRATYGGSSHDFIDERVQFRILLFHEHRYIEYIRYGLLGFGYFIGPYVIPYPVLNLIRDVIVHYVPDPKVRIYFFTMVGWVFFSVFCFAVYRLRKKQFSSYLWFCLFSFTVITLFYSFAWTVKDSFLASAYAWSENRWRYLGFTFFATGVSIFCHNYFNSPRSKSWVIRWIKKPIVGIIFLCIYLTVNILLLNGIEENMFRENSLPAVVFYKSFLKTFPQLSSHDSFYEFRASPGLNDFMAELSTTYKTYYSKLKNISTPWIRSEMYYILRGLQQKAPWAYQVHFIDYSVGRGVRDYTKEVRSTVSILKPIDLSFTVGSDSTISVDTTNIYPVEYRYNLTINYQASGFPTASGTIHDQQQIRALSAFSSRLASLLSDIHISDCKTMGYEKEPFYDVRKELALDANLSNRSYWWADCRPAWIVLDIGKQSTFAGAAWASLSNPDATPRDYHYDVSRDGKIWSYVAGIKSNQKKSKIDIFPRTAEGRYLRLWVDETAYRQMLVVNEFVPLFPETVQVAKFYDEVPKLYDDMYFLFDKVDSQSFPLVSTRISSGWMKVKWDAYPDNSVPEEDTTLYRPIFIDNQTHQESFELSDSDFYSTQGEFLKRKLTHIALSVPKNVRIQIHRIQVSSPFGN